MRQILKENESSHPIHKIHLLPINVPYLPEFSPSQANITKLYTTQSDSFTTMTGCLETANIQHLHKETKILLMQTHLNVLRTQLYATALEPSHPNNSITNNQSLSKNKKLSHQSLSKNKKLSHQSLSKNKKLSPCLTLQIPHPQQSLH